MLHDKGLKYYTCEFTQRQYNTYMDTPFDPGQLNQYLPVMFMQTPDFNWEQIMFTEEQAIAIGKFVFELMQNDTEKKEAPDEDGLTYASFTTEPRYTLPWQDIRQYYLKDEIK